MPTSKSGEKKETNAIIKFVGQPIDPDKPKELTRWQRFIKALTPWANKGSNLFGRAEELTEAYYSAEVSRKEAESEKFAAEAENIAADTDIKQQKKVKMVNDEISRIFSNDNLPNPAKQLQLANLLANNPEIAEQLGKIETMMAKMQTVNFTKFHIEIGENKPPELGDD